MYMSYFIFIYPEKPSVLRRCSVRAVVRWRCGWVFSSVRTMPSSQGLFRPLTVFCIFIHQKRICRAPYFLPTPRECLRCAPDVFRRAVRPYFGVCASLCMSDVCAILPSGCAFSVMRKRLYDNAKEPLPHLRSAFSVASYSLSGHAIKPLPSLLMPVGRSRETFSGCRKGFSACSAFLFRDFPLSKFFTAV